MRFLIFFSQLAVCFSRYVQTKLLQKPSSQVISAHNINTTETCAKNVTDTHSPLHVCNIKTAWSTLIGRRIHSVATPALLCHKEPAQGT